MSEIIHNVIVVTGWKEEAIFKAHQQAVKMFEWVSGISPVANNRYRSFFVPPDGSKEGWPEANASDKVRLAFIDYCKAQAFDDGSNSLCAIDVSFSGNGDAKVKREV